MRRCCSLLIVAAVLVSSPLTMAQHRTPDENTAPASQPAATGRQPRLLYGCGIIPSVWLHKPRSFDEQSLRMVKEMGGTHFWVNIGWPDLEPKPGQRNRFEYTDFIVRIGREQGLEMFAVMTGTPRWALAPELADKSGMTYRSPPAEAQRAAFADYYKTVAQRYRGKIKYYQFWNEPNGCSWVKDNCSNSGEYASYTKWLKVWHTAMKAGDPDCVLAAGGMDYHDGMATGYTYLEGMYREGAKGYFDAFAIHPYDKSGKGALHLRALRDTRRVMVANGDADKPIWITEYTWAGLDQAKKAELVRQALTELNSPEFSYVSLATFLSLTDPPHEGKDWGLCDEDFKPRPAYEAFKAFKKNPSRR